MPTFQAFTIICKHLSIQEDSNNLQAVHEYYHNIWSNKQALWVLYIQALNSACNSAFIVDLPQ
jgi:hypothetical protein